MDIILNHSGSAHTVSYETTNENSFPLLFIVLHSHLPSLSVMPFSGLRNPSLQHLPSRTITSGVKAKRVQMANHYLPTIG